jgi:hypothetical protein
MARDKITTPRDQLQSTKEAYDFAFKMMSRQQSKMNSTLQEIYDPQSQSFKLDSRYMAEGDSPAKSYMN